MPTSTDRSLSANRPLRRSWAEPWKVKVVELLKMTTQTERERAISEAGYNTFLLRSEDVHIDPDRGTICAAGDPKKRCHAAAID